MVATPVAAATRRGEVAGRPVAWLAGGSALALGGWLLVASAGRVAHPWPRVGLLAAAAVAFLVSRRAGRLAPWLAGAVTAAAAAGAAVPGALDGGPLAPPLGYGNADGALYAVAAAGACVVAAGSRRTAVRAAGLAAATAMVALTTVVGSVGALVGSALVVMATAAAVMRRPPAVRAVAAVAALLLAGGLAVTGLAGALHHPGRSDTGVARLVATAVTGRRVALWHDAVTLTRAQPLRGVGPGRFPTASPVARSDSDTRWAHSLPLELAAESGVPALVALAGVVGGLLVLAVRTAGRSARPAAAVVGIATVTGLGLQTEIDYVAHFPAVVCAAAVVTGCALAERHGRSA